MAQKELIALLKGNLYVIASCLLEKLGSSTIVWPWMLPSVTLLFLKKIICFWSIIIAFIISIDWLFNLNHESWSILSQIEVTQLQEIKIFYFQIFYCKTDTNNILHDYFMKKTNNNNSQSWILSQDSWTLSKMIE